VIDGKEALRVARVCGLSNFLKNSSIGLEM
jgi:hypothetical protein